MGTPNPPHSVGGVSMTIRNSVRHSAYLHAAGRADLRTDAQMGECKWEAGLAAACVALGA
jgi:hypothetical protein